MARFKTIFFDFGGTLAFEPYSHEQSFYAYLQRVGIEASYEDIVSGCRALEAFHTAWIKTHSADTSKKVRDRFWYRACLEFARCIPSVIDKEDLAEVLHADHRIIPYHLYEDTIPTLEHFRRSGIRMGVISNWDAPTFDLVLRHLGIRTYFAAAVSSHAVECEKPAPGIFGEACRRAAVSPQQAAMVGDTPETDLVGAKNVGMTPIWINRGGTTQNPDYVTIYTLKELQVTLAE